MNNNMNNNSCISHGDCDYCEIICNARISSARIYNPTTIPVIGVVAILSTTVLPLNGTYTVCTLENQIPNITGIPHYIGHPDTKAIVESLGAVQSESKLFKGLQPGESAIACSIKQGMSTRATSGSTNPHQEITSDMLDFRIITRARNCCYCKEDLIISMHCSGCGA